MRTLICVLGLGLILTGCSTTGERTSAAPKLSDSELQSAIESRWAADPAMKDLHASADAQKNEVTLSGTVATQEARLRAVELAKAANPGLIVTDKIDVKPAELARDEYTEDMARKHREDAKGAGERIGASLDDAWIHTKITSKLLSNGDTPARKINVDVENNVVTLRGHVESATAKAEAERIAKETDGVKRVINRIVVQSA